MSNVNTVTGIVTRVERIVTRVERIVTRVERIGHTMYGNPIMRIGVLSDGAIYRLRISDNSALVYEIENPEFKTEAHAFAITASGRVSHVVRNGAAL